MEDQAQGSGHAGTTGADEEALSSAYPVGLQRRRVSSGFPTLLDIYVIRRLLGPFAMVLVSTSLLYVVIDLTDNVDDMAKNHTPFDVIVGYYVNLVPQLIMDIMPLALMISVLILLTLLERKQELTAFKAGGISLYRVVVPILLIASLAAGAMWVLSESVVPNSNRKAKKLLDRIKGRETPRSYSAGGRQWLLSRDDLSFYNFLQFDESDQSMVRFTKLTIDEGMELRLHLFAQRVTFTNGAWIAQSGWYRQIEPDGTVEFEMITGPTEVGIPESSGVLCPRAEGARRDVGEGVAGPHQRTRGFGAPPGPVDREMAPEARLSPLGVSDGLPRVALWPQPRRPTGDDHAGNRPRVGARDHLLRLGGVLRQARRGRGPAGGARRLGARHPRLPLRHQSPHHPANLDLLSWSSWCGQAVGAEIPTAKNAKLAKTIAKDIAWMTHRRASS